METTDLRCPRFNYALLARLTFDEALQRSADGQHIEFACAACKAQLRKRGLIVRLVLHRFDLRGTFVETEHSST